MSPNVLAVARNDLRNARRSKLLWGTTLLYSLFAALYFYVGSTRSDPDVTQQLFFMSGIGVLVIPLIALVSAYLAVAGERESGQIKFRLGLPNSRADVVAGKFVSRAAIVTVAILLAFVVGAGLAVGLYEEPHLDVFPAFTAVTLLFALAYVGIAVGISTATASRSRAMGAAIAYFFVFNVLWAFGSFSIPGALRWVLDDQLGLELHQHFYDALYSLSPTAAYFKTLRLALDPAKFPQIPDAVPEPFYLKPWFMLLLLVGWTALPVAAGYLQFRRADVG